ncbi:uncharacterized protein LOC126747168 [Anthonomus grandis grandis]|uniref:uncharacterized protein LOC126747168 n=1 Tax=Anthonomus grandis grandis TaxID=2921223 RepID=UPI0021657C8D|nr:uncharacterized protein LOC126747168 [Anthonomus grandis grandis]
MAAYYWVDTKARHGHVPSTALRGGTDIDGAPIFVGRGFYEGDWIPAKVIPSKHVAYVPYNGKEIALDNFQVLCEQQFDWVPSAGGHVPEHAVIGGRTSDGENLYIGRTHHNGSHTVGKVHPSHRTLYIPFNGKEVGHKEYEILVLRPYRPPPSYSSIYSKKPPQCGCYNHQSNPNVHRIRPACCYPPNIGFSPQRPTPPPPPPAQCTSCSCRGQPNRFGPPNKGGIRPYYWVDTFARGGVPSTALQGGHDIDGSPIFVGRAYHEGDWIPAKVIPDKQVAYVAYGGAEHAKGQYQVLCEQRFDWVPTSGGHVPPGAVEGGKTSDGETLYVGRVHHDGACTVGKVHPSHGVCYIPFDGREVGHDSYEILVLRN